MTRFFKSELYKLSKNKFFYLSCIFIFILTFQPIIKSVSFLGFDYDWLYVFLSTHGWGATTLPLFLPLIVSITYCSSFYEDKKSGFINFYVSRGSLKEYLRNKIFFNMLLSAFIISINILLSFITCNLLFKNPIDFSNISNLLPNHFFANLIINNQIVLFIIVILSVSIIHAILFSSIGLLSSLYLSNKYINLICPFLFYILTSLIALNSDIISLHFSTTFTGYLYSNKDFIISMAITIFIVLLTNCIFYIKVKKRGIGYE